MARVPGAANTCRRRHAGRNVPPCPTMACRPRGRRSAPAMSGCWSGARPAAIGAMPDVPPRRGPATSPLAEGLAHADYGGTPLSWKSARAPSCGRPDCSKHTSVCRQPLVAGGHHQHHALHLRVVHRGGCEPGILGSDESRGAKSQLRICVLGAYSPPRRRLAVMIAGLRLSLAGASGVSGFTVPLRTIAGPAQMAPLSLPRRALVAVGRGDNASGQSSRPGSRAAGGGRRWPSSLSELTRRGIGR